MQIITDERYINAPNGCVSTIGTFDGLHLGHLEIIKKLNTKSNELKLPSVVITFFPHPRTVIKNNYNIKLLTPLEEKKALLKNFDIDFLYIINFTQKFAKKTYAEFFDEYLIDKLQTKHLVIGYDHKFGNDRAGDINKLESYAKQKGIGFTVVGPKTVDNEIISSTKIRNDLVAGEIESANKKLSRYYSIEGIIVQGAKRGRTLGFPTANLEIDNDLKLIPPNGVYLVKVKLNMGEYFGVANIGLRPTFNNVKTPIAEVFIFDFNSQIYGEKILVKFIHRLRDEKKFSSKEELEKQIKNDVKISKQIIKDEELM